MKTNKFRFSTMAMAALLMAGCAQNDELGENARPSSQQEALNVIVTEKGIENADGHSRAVTEEYTTTFEADEDRIGVFVIDETGKALVSNMPMTYDGSVWSGNTLYYYPNADYIAYFPYDESLPDVANVEDIVAYFEEEHVGTNQSSEEAYKMADLMTAEVPAANVQRGENAQIIFTFEHRMSMIELLVPVREYTTAATDGWTYSAPLGLSLKVGDTEGFVPYTKEKGTYRFIVAAGEEIALEGSFKDGQKPVYFPAASAGKLAVTPNAGEYTQLDINYEYEGVGDDNVRALQPGDYYYSDGSIWPGNVNGAPKEGCIGIIFDTNVSSESAEYEAGYTHGYVVALRNANEGVMGTYTNRTGVADYVNYVAWGTGTVSGNIIASGYSDLAARKDGYSMTQSLVSAGVSAAKMAQEFGTSSEMLQYAAPEGTSGWFLPAFGQIVDILNALSPEVEKEGNAWDLIETNMDGGSDDQTQKVELLNALKTKFASVGGDFFDSYGITHGKNPNETDRWWATTEVNANEHAWAVELKTNGQITYLNNRGKTGKNASVRPILAF